jgi:hypothetical protein
MVPSNRLNFVPSLNLNTVPGPTGASPFATVPSSLPSRDNFKSAFLALPSDRKYYQALDRLTQQLSIGKGGAVSKQMVTLTCSFSSPDDQEDFWKWLEDVQGVKVPWKAGATLTWKIQKQPGWINFDVWVDPNLF